MPVLEPISVGWQHMPGPKRHNKKCRREGEHTHKEREREREMPVVVVGGPRRCLYFGPEEAVLWQLWRSSCGPSTASSSLSGLLLSFPPLFSLFSSLSFSHSPCSCGCLILKAGTISLYRQYSSACSKLGGLGWFDHPWVDHYLHFSISLLNNK